MEKVKVATFNLNKYDEYCQKLILMYSYLFDHKTRTNYLWKVVEPIFELRKIGKSYHRVAVAKYIEYWNPEPLSAPLDSLKADIMHSIRGLGSNQKIPYLLNLFKSTLHYCSFQNGLIELPTIIIFDNSKN